MKFNIIGAGRLGKHLMRALLECPGIPSSLGEGSNKGALRNDDGRTECFLYTRHLVNADNAISGVRNAHAISTLSALPCADFTFITTPDDAIAGMAIRLAEEPILSPGCIVAHCSGTLSSEILQPLRAQGCYTASIHPLKAFSNSPEEAAFHNCVCIIEGDNHAVAALSTLFTSLGASIFTINQANKPLYHAAAVMASNYVVTLAACAAKLFEEAGLSPTQSRQIGNNLLQSSVHNIQNATQIADALTGPLMRGDVNTIAEHIASIQNVDIKNLYRTAALATLPLTNLSDEVLTQLKACLGTADFSR